VGCITVKHMITCSQHAIRTVNVLARKRVDNAVYDFGNLHTDFQSVSFLVLVQAVQQRTQEIVQLNGAPNLVVNRLPPSEDESQCSFFRVKGDSIGGSQGSSTHKVPARGMQWRLASAPPEGEFESFRFSLTHGRYHQLDNL
jgi:hypothetical protein